MPRRSTASLIEATGRPPFAAALAQAQQAARQGGIGLHHPATSSRVASSRRLISMTASATPFGLGSWPLIRSCSILLMYYVLMNIECDGATLTELEHGFKFNDAILRHLTIKTKRAVSTPSPMMKDEKSRSLLEVREPAPAETAQAAA
jgi:hypothetical protein